MLEYSSVNLHWAITAAFPNKIQACTQKPDEPVHDYYNQLQIIFKENSYLTVHAESTQVAFHFMFISKLTWVSLS